MPEGPTRAQSEQKRRRIYLAQARVGALRQEYDTKPLPESSGSGRASRSPPGSPRSPSRHRVYKSPYLCRHPGLSCRLPSQDHRYLELSYRHHLPSGPAPLRAHQIRGQPRSPPRKKWWGSRYDDCWRRIPLSIRRNTYRSKDFRSTYKHFSPDLASHEDLRVREKAKEKMK
jgi:hypothetical protein